MKTTRKSAEAILPNDMLISAFKLEKWIIGRIEHEIDGLEKAIELINKINHGARLSVLHMLLNYTRTRPRKKGDLVYRAKEEPDLLQAARSIQADLMGNADSRRVGQGFTLIETKRIDFLLTVLDKIDNAEAKEILEKTDQTREPEERRTAHTEHCCVVHGCKYGDVDCHVYLGYRRQSYICETCDIGGDVQLPNMPSKEELQRRRQECANKLGFESEHEED